MKLKNVISTAALLCLIQSPSHCHEQLLEYSETPEQETMPTSNQKQMIANFFNIVIQGLLLVSSEKKEEKVQAAANAINSISNITQLAVRSPSLSSEELLEYATMHQEEILASINSVMYSECRSEHAQID